MNSPTNPAKTGLEHPEIPRRTRLQEMWLLFKENRLAILGLVIFLLFFSTAVVGLILTSGQDPVINPALIRLQEKLLPPLARPNLDYPVPARGAKTGHIPFWNG